MLLVCFVGHHQVAVRAEYSPAYQEYDVGPNAVAHCSKIFNETRLG